jgi:hypothetical protein
VKNRGLCLLLLGIAMAACRPAAPPPAPPATPIVRSTLPPTWTPSPTWTVTPTATATATPSVTPTESAEDLCAGFSLLYDFTQRQVYSQASYVPIIVQLNSPNAVLHFRASRSDTGDGRGFELPGGRTIAMEFHLDALPGPGDYDWTMAVHSEQYGDLCAISGSFTVVMPTVTPTPDLSAALSSLIDRILGGSSNPTPSPASP